MWWMTGGRAEACVIREKAALLLPGAPVPCGDGVGRAVLAAGRRAVLFTELRALPGTSLRHHTRSSWSDVTRHDDPASPGGLEDLRSLASALQGR